MKKLRLIGLLAVMALIAVACSPDSGGSTTTQAPATTTTTPQETTTTEGEPELQYDAGVTPAPCEDAVNTGNGCIYLGVISDLTVGPFAPLGVPLTRAQTHFWDEVNQAGGIGGFDVIISEENTFDAEYLPDLTATGYAAIKDRVLMLAQSLGTPQTQGILNTMVADNMVAAPATWYSGWGFPTFDQNLILESGAPYCFEAINGLTYMKSALETAGLEEFTWAIVKFPGDYGGDYEAGAMIAAAELELGFPLFSHLQIPFSAQGTADEAISLILQHRPDLIVMVTGPQEMATIAGGVFQGGHQQFQILGASPTWNVALTQSPAMPLLEGVYKGTGPWGPWGTDTPGHAAIRDAAAARDQGPNGAYGAGWVWQYPVKALLEAAIADNNLTRANLVALAGTLEGVDYQGILPVRDYTGSPADNVVRSTWISKADASGPDGLAVMPGGEAFISPITQNYPFTAACS